LWALHKGSAAFAITSEKIRRFGAALVAIDAGGIDVETSGNIQGKTIGQGSHGIGSLGLPNDATIGGAALVVI
jgi:hypothetical protein